MGDDLTTVAGIEAKMAAETSPPPVESTAFVPADPPPAPVDTPAQDDDWSSAIPPDTLRTVGRPSSTRFPGSAVVAYICKTKDLRVLADDRLRYGHPAARAIIENCNVHLPGGGQEMRTAVNRENRLVFSLSWQRIGIAVFLPDRKKRYKPNEKSNLKVIHLLSTGSLNTRNEIWKTSFCCRCTVCSHRI